MFLKAKKTKSTKAIARNKFLKIATKYSQITGQRINYAVKHIHFRAYFH